MSCESESQGTRFQRGNLPEWFDNLGATYGNSGIPGVKQLGKLMQAISVVDAIANGPDYSLSNIGKAWGGLVGSVAGGAIGGIGASFLIGFLPLGAGVLATAAAVSAAMAAAYYGSRKLEELFEERGGQMGQEWENALRGHKDDMNESTNGSDPSSGCPENEGQSGMGGPFHNGPNTPLIYYLF